MSTTIHARDFGLTPDTATDATPAVRRALDACRAAAGAVTFRDNVVERTRSFEPHGTDQDVVTIKACRNVRVEGNRIAPEAHGTVAVDGQSKPSTVVADGQGLMKG